jgi:hypothetical protein
LREKLRYSCRAAQFAVAGDTLVDLIAEALEGLVQSIEVRTDNTEQRLTIWPTTPKFDFSAACQDLHENHRVITLEQHTGNPGHVRVPDKAMQPHCETADNTLRHEIVVITQHQILRLAPICECAGLSGRQQLWREPSLGLTVSQ